MPKITLCLILISSICSSAFSELYFYDCAAINASDDEVDSFRFTLDQGPLPKVTNFEFENEKQICAVPDSKIAVSITENELKIMFDQISRDKLYRTIILNQGPITRGTIYYKFPDGDTGEGYDYVCQVANVMERPALTIYQCGN